MNIDQLIRGIESTPSQIRHLRPKINQTLNRPSGQSIASMLDDHYSNKNSLSPGEGLYEVAPQIDSFAECRPIFDSAPLNIGRVNFLTNEKPLEIISTLANSPKVPPVIGYISSQCAFAFSVIYDVPILFKLLDDVPQIVSEISSPHYEGVYAVGGKRHWKRPSMSLEDVAIIFDEFVGYNYCHWLLDWLPRLALLKRVGVDISSVALLLTRKPTMFQRQTLERIGIKEEQCFPVSNDPGGGQPFIGVRNFFATSATSVGYRHALHGGSTWAADFLRSNLIRRYEPGGPTRIILDRKTTRKLVFDARSRELLADKGFVTVYAEELSIERQVELFAKAEKIIAAHGAGLSNLVFCREGASILEVFPPNYSTAAYCITASAVGLNYSCAVAKIVNSNEQHAHIRDYDLQCEFDVICEWVANY